MAFSDAIHPSGGYVLRYPELVVHLGPEDGSVPMGEVFDGVHAAIVVQSAGGSRLDYAELQYAVETPLRNREQPAAFSRMVEVRLPDDEETRLHIGDYVTETASITKGSETLQASSQMRPYHFGDTLTGYYVWDPIDSIQRLITDHAVFNPTVDGKVVFNRSSKQRSGGTLSGFIWTHPEIADNSAGITYQGQTRGEWSLQSAAGSICELLNEDEEFILRPNTASLLLLADGPAIRDVTIPIGTRLPAALDTLLIPHGYNWYLDYTDEKPRITFFKIGDGEEKELHFPDAGESLFTAQADVNQLEVRNAIGDSFSAVRVVGDFEEVEVTLPLYPGWPAADDSASPADLAKDGASYPGKESVRRLYIANEAGDIDPTVSRLGQLPVVPDLGGVVSTWVPHRRTLQEPLTYQAGNDREQRLPIKVEYSTDGGSTWKPEEPGWTIKLCPDQIGIYFDGVDIPQQLYDAGSDGRVRITGCVYSDYRVQGYAAREAAECANGRVFEQTLFLPDKFQRRWRNTSGTYRSVLIDTGNSADEVNNSTDALTYAEKIRDQNHFAEIDCEFRLPGWHTEYQIGDLITKIAGREISLNAAPATASSSRYVQIVERRFEMSREGGPSTVLIVDRGVTQ